MSLILVTESRTMPFFCLFSLFYVNFSLSPCFFLILANVYYFPCIQKKKNSPWTPYCLPSTLLLFLIAKLPKSLVSRQHFQVFSHSHANHFTSVFPFPTTLKITGETHHVKYNRDTCLISSICQQSVPTHVHQQTCGNMFL